MKSFLVLVSLLISVAFGKTSVITLLDDDVSTHPLCQGKDLLGCQKAQVNVDAILDNDPLCFPAGITMHKTATSEEDTGTKVIHLEASNRNSSVGLATITTDKIVTLDIDTAHGKDYSLVNCGPDCYLWRTINETFYHHLDFSLTGVNRTGESNRELDPVLAKLFEESRQSNQQVVITVKLYYTTALRNSGININAVLESKVIQTNTIMSNSDIPITFRGLCPELMSISESGNSLAILNRAQQYFGSLPALYDGADLSILMTLGCTPDACGRASTINVINPTFPTLGNTRFAWAATSVGPLYTFAHELGHLMGGQHDRGQLGCGSQCLGTPYGYLVQGLPYHTVMAYGTNTNPNAIPYFSTPTLSFPTGQPIGTSMNDVRSTLLSVRFAVSQLGNDQCGRGCFNVQTPNNCNYWSQQGYCQQTYVAYMRANCAFTCGFC